MNPFQLLKKPITNLDPALFKPAGPTPAPVATPAVSPFSFATAPLPKTVLNTAKLEMPKVTPVTIQKASPISIVSRPLPEKVTQFVTGVVKEPRVVRNQDFKDVVNMLGDLTVGFAGSVVSGAESVVEAVGGKKLPKVSIPMFKGQKIDIQSAQRQFDDLVAQGATPDEAFSETATKAVMDISMLVPISRSVGKFALLKTAPEKLINPEVIKVERETLRDYFSGRRPDIDIPQPLRESISKVMQTGTRAEKVQLLKGIEMTQAKPSILGRFFGISEEEASQILKDLYGGPVREASAGALPGYAPEFEGAPAGLSVQRVKRVGGEYPENPSPAIKETVARELMDVDAGDPVAVKGAFVKSGYVDVDGFAVHPSVDPQWVKDLSPQTKQLMRDNGITYVDPAMGGQSGVAVEKSLSGNKVRGVAVKTDAEIGSEAFTSKDATVVHELGHHKWREMSPAEQEAWTKAHPQNESAYIDRLQKGEQQSGGSLAEENFAENFSKQALQATDEVLDPLTQKARKYKSAEEFVGAQGTPVYRGGLPYDEKLFNSGELRGISVSKDMETAQGFASDLHPADKYQGGVLSQGKKGVVEQLSIDKNANILDVNKAPKELLDIMRKENRHKGVEEISLWAEKNGYDAVDFHDFEIRVLNPDILKTKSQLTDLWEKANKTVALKKGPIFDPARVTEAEMRTHIREIAGIPDKEVDLVFDPKLKEKLGADIEGRYTPAGVRGQLLPMIELYINKGKVRLGTGFHESYHFVEDNFMTRAERSEAQEIAQREMGPLSAKAYSTYRKGQRLQEFMADKYADYLKNKAGYRTSPLRKIFLILDRILKRITDAIEKVKNYWKDLPNKQGGFVGGTEEEIAAGKAEVEDFKAKAEKQLGRPILLTAKEKRLVVSGMEKANREYLKTVRKEMEVGLPRSKSEREVLITEARLSDELKKAGMVGDDYKADQVMSEIEAVMQEAEPGERVFIGTGADREVKGVQSTFPKWVPEHLRSRELFDAVEPSLRLDQISMPSGRRQQELFNVVFDRIDQNLGIDTKSLRQELADKVRSLPASKVMERESKAIERLMNRTARETEKMVSVEEKKARLQRDVERRQKLFKLEEERLRQREQKITETRLAAQKKKNIFKVFRDTLFPSQKGVDKETKAILEDWVALRFSAKEAANETYLELKNKGPQTLEEIKAYEAGKPVEYIKEELDAMGTLAGRAGIEFSYREGYLPHAYAQNREQVMTSIEKYLREEKKLDDFELKQYMAGAEMNADKSRRLKLNPFFSKERVFPSYSVAIKYGLTPKYTSPAKLIAHYQEELETVLANNKLIADLKAEGKLLNEFDAPETWSAVTRRFSKNVYYAEPTLAKALNDFYRDENNLKIWPRIVKPVSRISNFMQELALSAGVPFTNINYFSTGQAIRLLTNAVGEVASLQFKPALSTLKSAFAYIRANSNRASAKFFFDNRQYIARMALEGIDVSGRVGNFRFQKLGEAFRDVMAEGKGKGPLGKIMMVRDLLGVGFNKAFNEKTFNSMMSQVAVQTFKDVYNLGIQKGMTDSQASKFAADTVRNFTGLSAENLRGKTTQDTLKAFFFAPKFREGVMNIVYNTVKGFTPKNFKDASFAKNRAFLLGVIITFALYQLLNKKTSGQYTWENPAGREFAWRVPLPNGDITYVEFLPSFFAFPRNIVSGGIALGKGDFETATQKFGTVFSMPIKLASELISNSDYFQRPIYKETDSAGVKIGKMAAHVGLGTNHPFIRETYKYASGQEPLYQAALYALEAPLKFGNLDKEQKSAYYNMLDKQTKKRADLKKEVMPIYQQNQKLKAEGKKQEADRIYRGLSKQDRAIYDQIKRDEKASATAKRKPFINSIYESNQELIAEGRVREANQIYRELSEQDRKIYDSIKRSRQLTEI